MKKPWNIVVMRGGPSEERAVSLSSGQAVIEALKSLGHVVTDVDPRPGDWKLPETTDAVFLALHGTYGEDGTIQRELEAVGVPYTGCGPETSALAFDKARSKAAFEAGGVPTAPYVICGQEEREAPTHLGLPLVIKPARQGSSVGIEMLRDWSDWPGQLDRALAFGGDVVIEPFIEGREITVGVLEGEALPIVEVCPKQGFYDYHHKYTAGATEYVCPALFPDSVRIGIEQAALAAMAAVGGGMYARVDFMVGEDTIYALEVNTLPGMTATSLLPKAAAAKGISFPELCERLVGLALAGRGQPVT